MKRKILALLVGAPILLVGCNPSEEPSDISSTTPPISTPSENPDDGGSNPPASKTLTNFRKAGHVALSLDFNADPTNFIAALVPSALGTIDYSSELEVYYTKADNVFQYMGDYANFDVRLYPNRAYVGSDGVDAQTQVYRNLQTVGTAFNIFNRINAVGDLLDMGGLGLNLDIKVDAPAYYRTANSYYKTYTNLTDTNRDDLAHPENYADYFGVSLLNGKNGYFTDLNPSIKASDGVHDQVRGYEEFNLGGGSDGSEDGGGNIITTIIDLISGIGSLGIDFENLDIPGLINLLIPMIPTFDFDIADVPVAGYIGTALDAILHGLEASLVETVDEVTGESHRTLTVGINDEGCAILSGLIGEVLPDSFSDVLSYVGVNYLELSLDFVKGAGLTTYEVGGLYLDLGAAVVGPTINLMGLEAPIAFDDLQLHGELVFDPGETQVEDDYFTNLASDMEFYRGIHDQYWAFYSEVGHYVKFASFDSLDKYIDLTDTTLPARLDQLQEEFENLPEDVKAMFLRYVDEDGNNLETPSISWDTTAEYDAAVKKFEAHKDFTVSSISDLASLSDITSYPNWREYLGSLGGSAISNLDTFITSATSTRSTAASTVTSAIHEVETVDSSYLESAVSTLTSVKDSFGSPAASLEAVMTPEQLKTWNATSIAEAEDLLANQVVTYLQSVTDYSALSDLYTKVYEPLVGYNSYLASALPAAVKEAEVDTTDLIEAGAASLVSSLQSAFSSFNKDTWNSADYAGKLATLKGIYKSLNTALSHSVDEDIATAEVLVELGDKLAK